MNHLHNAVIDFKQNMEFEFGNNGRRTLRDENAADVARSLIDFYDKSHIAVAYSDNSGDIKTVAWDPRQQEFCDWNNNFWLSRQQDDPNNPEWSLRARHDADPVIKAMLERGKHFSKYNRIQKLWRLYWQMIHYDFCEHNTEALVTLHVVPLQADRLMEKTANLFTRADYNG